MDHLHCTHAVLTGGSEVGDKEVALQQRRGGGHDCACLGAPIAY